MSVRAMAWAWDQECPTPAAKLVLLKLADRANDEGECWPSQSRIAADCGLSRQTVNAQIAAFERLGLLEAKSQIDQRGQHVSRYFLRCQNLRHPCQINGHPLSEIATPPVKNFDSHIEEEPISEPISELSIDTNVSISRPNRRLDKPDRFVEFYAVYPRHEARGDALKAWRTACKRADAEMIIAAAKRYAERRAGEDKQFTKLPATWLRRECWTDEEGTTNGHTYEHAKPSAPPPRPKEVWTLDDPLSGHQNGA